MTVATIAVAVDDPLVARRFGFQPERVETPDELYFLDGPVSARVAVVDRDASTGSLAAPVAWSSGSRRFDVPDDITERASIATSAFGLVLKTMSVFERPDVLGRRIRWAFDGPQLLVVPNAGTWENAFYDRSSRSLQFFSFAGPSGHLIRTALSRDIVTHETGHAILDSIAPPLYDALTPQTLGLHESIADMTAICMALESRTIRQWIVERHGAELSGSTPASELANEFGDALRRHHPLRDANNERRLDEAGDEPHDLSEVLTGGVWAAMVQLHHYALDQAGREPSGEEADPRARALGISARRIARILFRALDYLPPAEATFSDFARALLRSDEIAYAADETGYRAALAQEFVHRGIVADARELDDRLPSRESVRVDLDALLDSDWVAYDFVDRNRGWLGVPARAAFRLLPRVAVTRRYYTGAGRHEERPELVLKVTWEHVEDNGQPVAGTGQRAVFCGTTLVLGGTANDSGRHPVLSCLTTDGGAAHMQARERALRAMVARDQLAVSNVWRPMNVRPWAPLTLARTAGGVLRLRSTARLLHLAEVDR